ncbi:MAG: universal stress protein [Proteobacteria bacterium]|nr:universal stress protein [Pseudomonadota bacterium]
MFNKIVVGLDGSEASENALRITCDLARKYGSEIHLVNTPHLETLAVSIGGGGAVSITPSQDELDGVGAMVLEKGCNIAKKYGQTITKTHLVHGNAADQIVHCANECGADLIVTGRRGLGNLTGMILGSTSQRVNHYAKCACLTIA